MAGVTSGRGTSMPGNKWQGLHVLPYTGGTGYEWQGLRVAGVTSGRASETVYY